MKKGISLLMVFMVVLTLLGPVASPPNASVQLGSNEMLQITGGKTTCSSYAGLACCCLDLWILQFCFCVSVPSIM